MVRLIMLQQYAPPYEKVVPVDAVEYTQATISDCFRDGNMANVMNAKKDRTSGMDRTSGSQHAACN